MTKIVGHAGEMESLENKNIANCSGCDEKRRMGTIETFPMKQKSKFMLPRWFILYIHRQKRRTLSAIGMAIDELVTQSERVWDVFVGSEVFNRSVCFWDSLNDRQPNCSLKLALERVSLLRSCLLSLFG